MNSSDTFLAIAVGWAKRRSWASTGRRSQIRQGCFLTWARWDLSRRRICLGSRMALSLSAKTSAAVGLCDATPGGRPSSSSPGKGRSAEVGLCGFGTLATGLLVRDAVLGGRRPLPKVASVRAVASSSAAFRPRSWASKGVEPRPSPQP